MYGTQSRGIPQGAGMRGNAAKVCKIYIRNELKLLQKESVVSKNEWKSDRKLAGHNRERLIV